MTAGEFEDAVWAVENIRIIIRTHTGAGDEEVGDYDYENAAARKWTINKWLNQRVRPSLDDDHNIVVIDGSGERVHRGNLLRTVRGTYDS